MSTRMRRSSCVARWALRLLLWLALFCLPAAPVSAKPLPHADLLRVLECLTHKSAPIGLYRDYSGPKSFRVRYLYGTLDPSDRENELHLVVYGKDGRSAILYEILIEPQILTLVNAGSVEKRRGRWVVTETQGGVYSYERAQRLIEAIAKTPLKVIPLSALPRIEGECWFRPSPFE